MILYINYIILSKIKFKWAIINFIGYHLKIKNKKECNAIMKTKKLSNLSKILISFAIVCAMVFSVCLTLVGALSSPKAYAGYQSKNYLSESAQEKYNFTQDTGWDKTKISNYTPVTTVEGESTVTTDAFAGSSHKVDLSALTNFDVPASVTKPTLKFKETADNYVLAIVANNAPKTQEDENGNDKNVTYGFQSSSSLSLTKNSFYVLSFYVYTSGATNNVSASVRLSGDISYETPVIDTGSLDPDDPNNQNYPWSKHNIFIATHADNNDAIYVNLQYGNQTTIDAKSATETEISGLVMFDNITITQINYTDFMASKIDGETPTGTNYTHNARNKITLPTLIDTNFQGGLNIYPHFEEQKNLAGENANFNVDDLVNADGDPVNQLRWYYYAPKDLNEFTVGNYTSAYNANNYFNATTVVESDEFQTTDENGNTVDGPNTFDVNDTDNYILKLENRNSVYNLGLISREFNIDQFGLYRISVMFKAKDNDSTATFMVTSKIPTGKEPDGATFSATTTVTPFTEDYAYENDNYWKEAVIYVRGNALRTVGAQIVILANTNSTIYADNIRVERISSTAYSSGGTKLDLSPSSLLQSTSITNGYFNFVDISNNENLVYPLTPKDWTSSKEKYEDTEIVAGITSSNIEASVFSATWGTVNPIPLENNQKVNLLGIYSTRTSEFGGCEYVYTTSGTFSNSSKTVFKTTFDAFDADNFSGNIIARLYIYSNDKKTQVVDFKTPLTGSEEWKTYTIYVRTASSSVSFKLALGISDAQGTVFFRNVNTKMLNNKTVDGKTQTPYAQFDKELSDNKTFAQQQTNFIRFVDFVGDGATSHSIDTIEDKPNHYESINYTVDEKKVDDIVVTGDIFIANINTDLVLNGDITLNSSDLQRTGSKTDSILVLFNDGERYSTATPRYSMSLTEKLYYKLSVWVKTSEDVGESFTIKFKNVDTTFEKVNTYNEEDGTNEFVEYVAYVKVGNSAISNVEIQFMLGSADAKVAGYALISDISIDEMTEEKYAEATESVDANATTIQIHDYTTPATDTATTDNKKQTPEEESNTALIVFFVVFSSILTVAALVIALVSISIKKLRRQPKVVGKNNANVNKKSTNVTNSTSSKDGFV